jgi:hypothetical protein
MGAWRNCAADALPTDAIDASGLKRACLENALERGELVGHASLECAPCERVPALIMLDAMWSMLKNTRLNIALVAMSAAVLVGAFAASRSEAWSATIRFSVR